MAMTYLETMMTESVRRAQQQYYGHAAKITIPKYLSLDRIFTRQVVQRDEGTVGKIL